jgi:uncharacterized protein YeaO (DUF488 family)
MPARAATTARSAASQAGAGAPAAEDTRVLVDRLWPRELSRERAGADLGVRDIAPSVALRRRFHGSPTAWKELKAVYFAELECGPVWPNGLSQVRRTVIESW